MPPFVSSLVRLFFSLLLCGFFLSKSLLAYGETSVTEIENPDWALELHFSTIEYSKYQLVPGTVLASSGSAWHIAWEWIVLSSSGKLGLGFGAAYFNKDGIYVSPGVHASLTVFPVETFLSYRLDYGDDQLFVPYAKLGINVSYVHQDSADGIGKRERKNAAWDYGFGLQFCLDRLEPGHAKDFQIATGIQNTYLELEYLQSSTIGSSDPNTSSIGYRIGLRFEI